MNQFLADLRPVNVAHWRVIWRRHPHMWAMIYHLGRFGGDPYKTLLESPEWREDSEALYPIIGNCERPRDRKHWTAKFHGLYPHRDPRIEEMVGHEIMEKDK